MTCPNCGRWAPPDPETGYDADEQLCPDCDEERQDCQRDEYFDRLRDELEDGNPFE